MKIAIFAHNYLPFHKTKDPGQITLGLNEIGVKAKLVTYRKKELLGYDDMIIQYNKKQLEDPRSWQDMGAEIIISYTSLKYKDIFHAILASNKKLILKLDSDGRIIYPAYSCNERRFWNKGLARGIMRIIKWQLPPFRSKFSYQYINILKLADAIIIESPDARNNLVSALKYWKESDIAQKICVIPNPISSEYDRFSVSEKDNTVISIGRWEEIFTKNTVVMIQAITGFLEKQPKFKAIIAGSGEKIIKRYLHGAPSSIQKRVEITCKLPHSTVWKLLQRAKIFFMPSISEGAPLAAGEAAAMGLSIVGTPLEYLRYLERNGQNGTVATGFEGKELQRALEEDAKKWTLGFYNPIEMSKYWRQRLDRKNIAREILNLTTSLQHK